MDVARLIGLACAHAHGLRRAARRDLVERQLEEAERRIERLVGGPDGTGREPFDPDEVERSETGPGSGEPREPGRRPGPSD